MSQDQYAAREEALKRAIDLLRDSIIEYCVEDVLVVADWLLTGKADLVVALAKQRGDNYVELRKWEDSDGTGR